MISLSRLHRKTHSFIPVAFLLLLSACANTITPHRELPSHALTPAAGVDHWSQFKSNLPYQQADTSWFSLLNTGKDTLIDRLALIDSAQTSIDAQYFLWLEDKVGSLLFERLLAAADRGVRVRLLLDDSFLAGEDNVVLALSSHRNIQVRIFNPFSSRSESMTRRYIKNLNEFSRTNHRMHNKLLLADTTAGIVGGRNIADEYFGFGEKLNLRDFDLIVAGAIVPELGDAFDLFWNSEWAFPTPEVENKHINTDDLAPLRQVLRQKASALDDWQRDNKTLNKDWREHWNQEAGSMIPGRAKIWMDQPRFDKELPVQLARAMQAELRNSQTEVIAISAYLIMTDAILEAAKSVTDRGVKISFLTNSLATTNHITAHSAFRRHRKAILRTGANLYVMRDDPASRIEHEAPGFTAEQFGLHGKVVIFDHNKVFVGTLNMDPRSVFLNTEIGLLIESPELNREIRKAFLPDFEPGSAWKLNLDEGDKIQWIANEETLMLQPAGSIWRRVSDAFLGLYNADDEL